MLIMKISLGRRSGEIFFALKSAENGQKWGMCGIKSPLQGKKITIKLVMCEKNATFAY